MYLQRKRNEWASEAHESMHDTKTKSHQSSSLPKQFHWTHRNRISISKRRINLPKEWDERKLYRGMAYNTLSLTYQMYLLFTVTVYGSAGGPIAAHKPTPVYTKSNAVHIQWSSRSFCVNVLNWIHQPHTRNQTIRNERTTEIIGTWKKEEERNQQMETKK